MLPNINAGEQFASMLHFAPELIVCASIVLLLVLYLFRGTFSYLVGSPQDNPRVNISSPFLKIRD